MGEAENWRHPATNFPSFALADMKIRGGFGVDSRLIHCVRSSDGVL